MDSDLLDISRVTVSTVLITPDNGTKGILVEEESCTGTMVQGQFYISYTSAIDRFLHGFTVLQDGQFAALRNKH